MVLVNNMEIKGIKEMRLSDFIALSIFLFGSLVVLGAILLAI